MALPNGPAVIVSFLAASIAGTAAPLNPAYRYEEFCFYLEDTDARLLVVPPEGVRRKRRRAAAERKIPIVTAETNASGEVQHFRCENAGAVRTPAPEDIALILHTSGSTGRPKRVPLKHLNLALSARNIVGTYELSSDDVSLCLMPLFHVHGLVASTLSTLLSGGTVVVPGAFQSAVVLAHGAGIGRHVVLGRPHHPSAHPGAFGVGDQARGGGVAALHSLLQRAAAGRNGGETGGAHGRAGTRSLRHDRGVAPDGIQSAAARSAQIRNASGRPRASGSAS